MQYLGGKAKWGRAIVQAIEPWRSPGALWIDPTCGALNVVQWAAPPRIASDICHPLITTLRATLQGWDPPRAVTLDQYRRIRDKPDPRDPLTAYAMFGLSYGGKWGAGMFQDLPGKHTQAYTRSSLIKKAWKCLDLSLFCLDYWEIQNHPPPGTVIYLDPPYEGTTGYDAVPPFDSCEFWKVATFWARCGYLVFVSEGSGARPPLDWICYRSFSVRAHLQLDRAGKYREERLYVHTSSPMARSL